MTSCQYAFLSHAKSESQETPVAQIRFRVTHYGSKSLWHRAQLEIIVLNREHRKQTASSPELLVQEASYEVTKKLNPMRHTSSPKHITPWTAVILKACSIMHDCQSRCGLCTCLVDSKHCCTYIKTKPLADPIEWYTYCHLKIKKDHSVCNNYYYYSGD